MKRRLAKLLVILGALLSWFAGGTAAWALSVDLNGPGNTNATAIHGLEIQGLFYDVTFELVDGSLGVPYTSFATGDVFAGNQAGANAAVSAITAALNGVGATTVGLGSSGNGDFIFMVAYEIAVSCQDVCVYRGRNTSGSWVNNGDGPFDELGTREFARFAPAVAAVPVPPALYLFGTGVLLLIGRVRRGSVVPAG